MPFIRTTANGDLTIGAVDIASQGTLTIGNTVINSTSIASDTVTLPSGELVIGNSTVNSTIISVGNTVINTTSIVLGNVNSNTSVLWNGNNSINTTSFVSGNASDYGLMTYTGTYLVTPDYAITANVGIPQISVSNSTISVNVTQSSIKAGNTTVYGRLSSNTFDLVSETPNTSLHFEPVFINIGNTTTNVVINSTSVSISGGLIQANNGYSRLTNGLLVQWGNILANSSTGNVTFPVEYTTVFQAYASPSSVDYRAAVTGVNTTVVQVRSEDVGVAAELVRWWAIGI
jgi:hypothetical protein